MKTICLLAGSLTVCLAGSALAQEVPDLKGNWVEVDDSTRIARRGQTMHNAPTGDVDFTDALTWSFAIDRQEGGAFSGTWGSENRSEAMLGVISHDGETLRIVDENSFLVGTLRGPDEMELCAMHVDPETMLVACRLLTRQP